MDKMKTDRGEEILTLYKQNQEAAFRLLVKEYSKPIYYHVRRMVYDHDDANDITQNVFIKIYQNLNKFKGDSKLYSWIYRIATNETITFLNQKAKKNNVSFEEVSYDLAQNLESDAFFEGDKAELKLQKAIAQLPEKQRLVFQMKYFEEMKYEEISEILDTSVGALKASYHHAVKKIEELITKPN